MMLWLLSTVLYLAGAIALQSGSISFSQAEGALKLAAANGSPSIAVDSEDWYGVYRAAQDLALDFGRVTGQNASVQQSNVTSAATSSPSIIVGTVGRSATIQSLIINGLLDVSQISGQWEAYQTQLINTATGPALVIAGSDKRGTIYGIYDVSRQIGVSPWYWWADVPLQQQEAVYALNVTKVQGSPSVQYRGFFLNDEQPGLSDWVKANYPDVSDGDAGFGHAFYSTVFELLLRSNANYLWPAMWGSMFYVDDDLNAKTADDYGIVMGTSHTEPMARATNEQGNPELMHGVWSWSNNRENVTEFMREGAIRAKPYETLYTLGMRGLGDVASPTLNASQLEEIVQTQQQILAEVYNTTNVSSIPQMWCLYKEVGSYWAQGLNVPDDVTLMWAEDNWGNAQRLPLSNETSRSGGSALYYHVDYVGDPRDYKWINTINLQKSWTELSQAYARGAQRIWILNVGDLKPLEIPINHFLDMAYDINSFAKPNSTYEWMSRWSASNFGSDVGSEVADIIAKYSICTARRKYELTDPSTYNIINYEEADSVLSEWSTLAASAQAVYSQLSAAAQPSFFELLLHPVLAGYNLLQIHVGVAKNNLYGKQGRTSTNVWSQDIIDLFNNDYTLTQRYHTQLDGKWRNMLSQTHLGYQYWQQPMRNMLPPLAYVQQQSMALAGPLGVTCEGTNASVPGDDMYHTLSSNTLTLPPMDPFGPATRYIDIFSRGNVPVNFNISCSEPAVSFSQSSGTLGTNATNLDLRVRVSVDWSSISNATSVATINITTSTVSNPNYINASLHPYNDFNMPSIMLPLNKTTVPQNLSTGTFIESDGHISIQAEHFSPTTNSSSPAYLAIIPGESRTLSGLSLLPFTAPSQSPNDSSAPCLTYPFYTFTPFNTTNLTTLFSPALNTNPDRPLRYAISIDDSPPQVVQPVPSIPLGTLPEPANTNTTFSWTRMVSDAVIQSNTTWDLSRTGEHELKVWLLEPGLVLQGMVLDLGGVRSSYLGPPESFRVGVSS